MAQKGQNTPKPGGTAVPPGGPEAQTGAVGVAPNGSAPSGGRDGSAPRVLRPGRLDRIAKGLASQLRRAFATPDEAAYVWRRARALAGIRGRPRKAGRLPDVLTRAEVQAIIAAAYSARPRDGLVIRLLFESALRVSECSRLEVPDVDLAERTVRVREGKGGKDRVAFIGEDLAQLLRVHLGDRPRGPLFTSNRGTRLSVRRIQGIVRAAARRAGVDHKRISPHTFRHSWATLTRNAGLPLDTVQTILGHTDPRTTELYSRLAVGRAREEYDTAMDAIRWSQPDSVSRARACARSCS